MTDGVYCKSISIVLFRYSNYAQHAVTGGVVVTVVAFILGEKDLLYI